MNLASNNSMKKKTEMHIHHHQRIGEIRTALNSFPQSRIHRFAKILQFCTSSFGLLSFAKVFREIGLIAQENFANKALCNNCYILRFERHAGVKIFIERPKGGIHETWMGYLKG